MDQIYMEVELRRLTWLEQQLAEVGNASPALLGDDPAGSVSSRYIYSYHLWPLLTYDKLWNVYLLTI